MSHYSLLVTNTDESFVDEQLKPFDENLEVPKYLEYTRDGLIKRGRERIRETVNWSDEEVYQYELEKFDKDQVGPDGSVYSTYNPKAKWDWFVVGGRWAGYLLLKPGANGKCHQKTSSAYDKPIKEDLPGRADVARVGDVDWQGMRDENLRKAQELWSRYQQATTDGSIADGSKHAYWDFGKRPNESEAQFMQRYCSIATHAILHDGEWMEQGKVGWFGVVRDESPNDVWDAFFETFVSKLSPITEISIVDCHI